ncbi:hypothetical protein GW17_00000084 [Ensete ventricosum]|nr:hypothetical protein GW17_00000084 [Ensete ventricosum]
MEDVVKKMLKLIEADADSFAKRAELYFKRRPELISFVEDAYRAYRALAERYDHISGELHKANHTIATACPEQVQYAMLEEEDDNFPKAITPIDPSKINKPTVEGLMNRRRESESSIKRKQKNSNVPQINKEKAEVEIDKLQKGILVLQTEKEFIKSSYEIGIAKYWEIEKQIMDMQEKVSCLQDEFGTSAVIKDDEARALMTATALKSCEDAIVSLQEQRKKSLEQAKVESERIEVAKDKLKTLKGDYCQSEMEDAEMSGQNTQMSFTAEKMEDGLYSLDNARLELQSICEKIKTHFEMNPESSVIEIAEKINELVDKVLTLELTVSSQAVQINRLASENNELDNYLQKLEEEKTNLISDSNALSERLKEAEEELGRVQAIEKIVRDEEINFYENFSEACRSLSENKSEEHLQETMALIGELKNVIAMKDEEIQSLKQQLASLKMSSDITADAPSIGDFWDDQQKVESTSNSVMATESSNPQDSQMLEDLSICTTKRDPYDEFTEVRGPLEEGSNADRINEQESISPVEEKLRRDIDALLDRNLEFWLRFSTSFHHIQEFKAKYEDLQAAIDRLKDNKTRGSNDGVTGNHDGEPESAVVATRLRELKTELQVWLEQNALLKGELQSTISSLDDMQGEISTAANTKSETGEAMCTPCQAARFQGEVMNMKQEKNKAASELQEGLDQVRRLQAEIDLQWLYSHRFLRWSRLLHFFAPKFRCDLAAKSSRPRTARPLTWPNQRDWSKDTRCRTADLAHVRSATPTCRRTPHHQYGRRGGKRGSMVPYGRPGTGRVGNPHLQPHASPPVRQESAADPSRTTPPSPGLLHSSIRTPEPTPESPLIRTNPAVPKRLRSGRTSAHGPGPAKACPTYLKAEHIHLASSTNGTIILALEGGPMSPERSLADSGPERRTEPDHPRSTEEAPAAMPTPNRFWRMMTDPGFPSPASNPAPPMVTAEAFLGLTSQVQALAGMVQTIIPYLPQLVQSASVPLDSSYRSIETMTC